MEPNSVLVRNSFRDVDKKKLSAALNSTLNTIAQIAGGHLRVSPERAKEIERATQGKVHASVLRPDVFDPPAQKKCTKRPGRVKR